MDIGHAVYAAITDPNIAFWALVDKKRIHDEIAAGTLLDSYQAKADSFARELHALRFWAQAGRHFPRCRAADEQGGGLSAIDAYSLDHFLWQTQHV